MFLNIFQRFMRKIQKFFDYRPAPFRKLSLLILSFFTVKIKLISSEMENLALAHLPRRVYNLLGWVQIKPFLVQFWKSLAQIASAIRIKFPILYPHILVRYYSWTSLIWTPKGQSKVSVLERCLYYRGHHDDVTCKTPLTVLSVQ